LSPEGIRHLQGRELRAIAGTVRGGAPASWPGSGGRATSSTVRTSAASCWSPPRTPARSPPSPTPADEDSSASVGGGAPLHPGRPRPAARRKGADRPGVRVPGRHAAAGPELPHRLVRPGGRCRRPFRSHHELRQTAASLAIASGASVKGAQSMLGHASAPMTLDRYGHLFPTSWTRSPTTWTPLRADQVLTNALLRLPKLGSSAEIRPLTCAYASAPGRIRTCDTRFRKPMLYPLSYGGSSARGRPGCTR
jgi:hypothetical protein